MKWWWNRRSKCFWLFPLLALGCLGPPAHSQDRARARWYIDTLCSGYMAGRGYVDSGDTRAARFLAQRMEQIGLTNYGLDALKGWGQRFRLDVNTFPGEIALELDGHRLSAGTDYILSPECPGVEGITLRLAYADSVHFRDSAALYQWAEEKLDTGTALVLDRQQVPNYRKNRLWQKAVENRFRAGAVIILERKLTWGVGRKVDDYPTVHMQRGVVNGKPERLRLKVEQRFAKSYPGQNVVGYLPGRKSRDSVLLITAHYDHLGKMGDSAIFPGANDNASGIAMMMDLAEWFAQHPKQRPKRYDLAFIAFGGEEAGLVGSRHFVLNAPFALGRVAMVLNLDLMATGESGLMVVNGKNRPHYLQAIKKANRKTKGLSPIKSRPNAPNSDHFFFTRSGVPAFFWYLMGRYPYYHDVYDTPDKVGLAGYPGAFRLARQFVKMFPL